MPITDTEWREMGRRYAADVCRNDFLLDWWLQATPRQYTDLVAGRFFSVLEAERRRLIHPDGLHLHLTAWPLLVEGFKTGLAELAAGDRPLPDLLAQRAAGRYGRLV